MIENFEEITEDLTAIELKYVHDIEDALQSGLGNTIHPLKQPQVVLMINTYLMEKYGLFKPLTLNGVRLRKFVNYIRKNSVMPIIATSDGYSISDNEEVINSQIRSMEQRANSIMAAAIGLKGYLINKQILKNATEQPEYCVCSMPRMFENNPNYCLNCSKKI